MADSFISGRDLFPRMFIAKARKGKDSAGPAVHLPGSCPRYRGGRASSKVRACTFTGSSWS